MSLAARWRPMIISFGDDYEIDVERRELRRAQLAIHVEPQVFDLLVYLVQNRDRVVSKDDLIASVWAGRIVSDFNLNQPPQCRADGSWRQRRRSETDPDHRAQGSPFRRCSTH